MRCHLLLCLPDGSDLGLRIPKDKNVKESIQRFFDHWDKVAKNPKLHDHMVLEERCPQCGEALHAKELMTRSGVGVHRAIIKKRDKKKESDVVESTSRN